MVMNMEEEVGRLIGSLLVSGTSKEQWLQLAGSVWDREHAKLRLNVSSSNAAPAVPISTPSSIETPASTTNNDVAQYACPRCTGKFGKPMVFPRKAELIRHITHKCEQTLEMMCGETNCSAKLTRPDHFKEHLRKVHHLSPDEVRTKAGTATTFALTHHVALGCGFCRAVFVQEPGKYAEHIAGHFKRGLTVESWSPTAQILSLLYQSADVWDVWLEVIDEQLPGVHEPEQYISFTKETAASFVAMLEKGLDAETIRPSLWRLCFMGRLGEQMLSGYPIACSSSGHPTQMLTSADSGYGASSGQSSLRTFGTNPQASLQTVDTVSTEVGNAVFPSFTHHGNRSYTTGNPINAMNVDPELPSSHPQTRWFNDANDVIMHDADDPMDSSDMHQNQWAQHTTPEPVKHKSHGHRRSASEKLRGIWNEARRSLGLAGPPGA